MFGSQKRKSGSFLSNVTYVKIMIVIIFSLQRVHLFGTDFVEVIILLHLNTVLSIESRGLFELKE